MQELEVARAAARAGGDVVAKYFREGVSMRSKESYNLVSDADVESEQAIVRLIGRELPGHVVLGEEAHSGADTEAEHLWVIDPLDGTNNFAHKIPHFAVSIAYYRGGVPQCGVVYNPIREDWFEAVRGAGATVNGASAAVAGSTSLQEVLVACGFYYDRGAMMQATLDAIRDLFHRHIHGIRRFGTASLDLCQVGIGAFGAYFEYQLEPWDYGAGRLFVEEAGGRVTTCRGGDLAMARTSLLATNGPLHDTMLEIIEPHYRPEQW